MILSIPNLKIKKYGFIPSGAGSGPSAPRCWPAHRQLEDPRCPHSAGEVLVLTAGWCLPHVGAACVSSRSVVAGLQDAAFQDRGENCTSLLAEPWKLHMDMSCPPHSTGRRSHKASLDEGEGTRIPPFTGTVARNLQPC